ncbi:phosphoribosylglycinamide formyltransferase, partial [Rhizobium ruizarguesonis]
RPSANGAAALQSRPDNSTILRTIENQIYPQALRLFAEGRVTMEGGRAMSTEASTTVPRAQLISLIGDRS